MSEAEPLSQDDVLASATLVVPCYNEATRLEPARFVGVTRNRPHTRLLFVDDGSTDDTAALLARVSSEAPSAVAWLAQTPNQGKAEAVRQGMRRALADGAAITGYFDADLSTPPEEILRLLEVMDRGDADVVMGARVALLGHEIERQPARHYLGRLFASAASLLLQVRVYDTQCGAKLFRRSAALEAALAEPFRSRWAFDVELLGRLLTGAASVPPLLPARIREVPLRSWKDVPGSKLRPMAMVKAAEDLALIGVDLARRRRRAR